MARKIYTDLDFASVSPPPTPPAPAAANAPARLADIQSVAEGLAWKDSCRVSTQGNLNLASPGATIDGVTMTAGDRVLVRQQSTGSQNGIYVWNGAAVAATRSADANTADELEAACVTVEEGTDSGVTFRQTAVNFTLESGGVAWTTFGTAAPTASESTAGIAEIATQGETDTGSDDARFVTPLKLATWSGRVRKHSALIGDGSATQFDVTHNFESTQVLVSVFEVSSGDEVVCAVKRQSANVVRLNFTVAPTSDQFRVVIHA